MVVQGGDKEYTSYDALATNTSRLDLENSSFPTDIG